MRLIQHPFTNDELYLTLNDLGKLVLGEDLHENGLIIRRQSTVSLADYEAKLMEIAYLKGKLNESSY